MVTAHELSTSMGRVIQTAIALVVLALFGATAGGLPGMSIALGGGFLIADIVGLAVAVALVALVVGTLPPLTVVITHYLGHAPGVRESPGRAGVPGAGKRHRRQRT
jgi:hypothetical protein